MPPDDSTTETPDSNPEGDPEAASPPDQPSERSHEQAADDGSSVGAATGGFWAGAVAVVSAGLGLSSLTGTSLGDMLRSREEIAGQIEAALGRGGDQVQTLYGAPWDMAALVNGAFALVAVLLGAVLLAALARRPGAETWVKAVALGGVVLGAAGLFVAGGMYFDLFADQPVLPASPGIGR